MTGPITPSLSPPQSPSFFSAQWRTPGSVPLQKRRRLSTPGRATSSSVQDQPIGFDQAKAESEKRLLDAWDRLAERYSRRIDEDDIVDLVTGDVIKDRGVLRSMERWEVGRFADEDGENDDRMAGEEEDVLEEESTDELDCLGDSVEEADLSLLGRSVVPSQAIDPDDPDDAELLREFSEAERRRKETCGSEEEDVHTTDEADHRTDGDDETEGEIRVLESVPHIPNQDHASDSDDDFCPWGEDVVLQVEMTEIKDVEPDVVPVLPSSTPTAPPSPSKPYKALRKSMSPAKPTKKLPPPPQLQTPPRSSSSVPPAEVEDVKIPSPSHSFTPALPEPKRPVSRPRTRSSGPVPRSLKSWTPFRVQDSETPPPRLDLSKMSGGSKRPSAIKASKKAKLQAGVAEIHQLQPAVPKRPLKAEVVIVKRSRSQSRAREVQVEREKRTEREKQIPQGKGKSVSTPENVEEKKAPQRSKVHNLDLSYDSDDSDVESDTSLPSSPLKSKGKAVTFPTSRRRSQAPWKRTEDLVSVDEGGTRKRKRVSDVHVDPGPSKPDISSRYSRPATPTPVSDRESSVEEIERPPKQNITPKQRSKTKRKSPESENEIYSFNRDLPDATPRRSQSYFNPLPPSEHYYPYSPAYPPREHGHYVPLYDPRAQYIISHAMHQLSALAGSWPGVEHHPPPPVPPPYTPRRHHGFSSSASSSMYNTPTQRMHPYPYEYDPNLSSGTLPPPSPDVQSSPAPERVQASNRAGSLVARSRSRGRRVSFRIEEEADIVELDSRQVSSSPSVRKRKDECHSVRQDKGKGKEILQFEEVIDDSESEPEPIEEPIKRGRSVGRAQTPAPQRPSTIPSEPFRRGRSLSARPIDSRSKSKRIR